MNKEELRKLYTDYLSEEGYKASVDEDGDIDFKYEGDNYIIYVEDDDPLYFRIQTGFGVDIKSDEGIALHLNAANEINSEYKLGRTYVRIDKELVMFELPLMFADPKDFKLFFKRCLSVLQSMVSDYANKLEQE